MHGIQHSLVTRYVLLHFHTELQNHRNENPMLGLSNLQWRGAGRVALLWHVPVVWFAGSCELRLAIPPSVICDAPNAYRVGGAKLADRIGDAGGKKRTVIEEVRKGKETDLSWFHDWQRKVLIVVFYPVLCNALSVVRSQWMSCSQMAVWSSTLHLFRQSGEIIFGFIFCRSLTSLLICRRSDLQ